MPDKCNSSTLSTIRWGVWETFWMYSTPMLFLGISLEVCASFPFAQELYFNCLQLFRMFPTISHLLNRSAHTRTYLQQLQMWCFQKPDIDPAVNFCICHVPLPLLWKLQMVVNAVLAGWLSILLTNFVSDLSEAFFLGLHPDWTGVCWLPPVSCLVWYSGIQIQI